VKVSLYFYRISTAGGAERSICWLANTLAERGFSVYLITLDTSKAESFYTLNDRVNWKKLGYQDGLLDKIRRTYLLVKYIKKENIPILIGFVISSDKTIYFATKISHIKLIVAERNSPSMYFYRYGFIQRKIIFLLLHFSSYITVQFPSFITGYPKKLSSRIKVIPNAVEIPKLIATPDKPNEFGRFNLLSVSRFDLMQKRLDLLITSFSKLKNNHPNWDLVIIGDGPDKNRIIELINNLNITERIKILPSSNDISAHFLTANLFAIPSRWEGFPNALAEAQSYGLPAVGFSGVSGVSDLICSANFGWLANGINDENEFTKNLNIAMTDNFGRYLRGLNARKKMKLYKSENQIKDWINIISTLDS
jgi:GalNAc-alpha-(1->4)-GalNAc-alpha-(1->3)-diNAcBac-PP-undecaprenol alpha-1,4-N-acetyl-D-galactosaminyltransferase